MAVMKFGDDVIIFVHHEYNLKIAFSDFEFVGFPEVEHF